MKTIEKILLVLVLVLIVAGAFIALRNIDFFNIEEIDVSVSGPVTNATRSRPTASPTAVR